MRHNLKKGDYVLATKYDDGDPQDHWCVGWYDSSYDHFGTKRHIIVDKNGVRFRANGFRRVAKLKPERGRWLLDNARKIEMSGLSVWHFYKCSFNPKEAQG